MSAKTIFIILLSVVLTIILTKNTGDVDFWLFADTRLPMLGILGVMFATGLCLGLILGRPRKRNSLTNPEAPSEEIKTLSDEDREYIQ